MASAPDRDESVIILARAAPFRLGALLVNPATREVTRGSESEILEPRVMQVLVALADAKGAVISRDELVNRCWDGRIVGDNAITRVMAQIRRLANDFAEGSIELETITKVGYRLREAGVPERPASPSADGLAAANDERIINPSRRRMIAGALALAGAGALGVYGWRETTRHRPPPEAAELFRRGEIAQRAGDPDQSRQAVTFLEEAVRIDPLYAEAWGALALAYRHILEGFGEAEKTSLAGRLRSAAQRALALDPENADAQLALVIVDPFFGRWRDAEQGLLRVHSRHPGQWLVNGQIGQLLNEVGRNAEAVPFFREQIRLDPMLPIGHLYHARGLSLAGRVQEAETALEQAQRQWPAHPAYFLTHFSFLLFTGRPGAAVSFVTNPDHRPVGLPVQAVEKLVGTARAFETRDRNLVEVVIRDALAAVEADPINHEFPTAILAMLGQHDDVFRILDRYFFGGLPLAPYERRYTYILFSTALRDLRADPRFDRLVQRIGLNRYWRESGTVPDYRRST